MHPNDGRVVSNFVLQALRNDPITIYGSGSQTRSFCYVDDLVTGLIAMMDQNEIIGPVNMGNPGEYSIKELAMMIKEISGSSTEIVFRPLPQDDPVRRKPDITLAREKLGWDPRISIREGLLHTIEYFRKTI
jgi:UDP-glucuronate decarboxylase